MSEVLAGIGRLVEAFGPTAAAFACVAGMLFFFYRRDHMAKQHMLQEVVMKNTESTDRLTAAVDKLSDTTNSVSVAYTRSLDTILRAFEQRQR